MIGPRSPVDALVAAIPHFNFPIPREGLLHVYGVSGNDEPGWPQVLPGGGGGGAGACIADVNGDGEIDVFAGGGTHVHGFDLHGTPLPGWPALSVADTQFARIEAPCSNGDLEGDGGLEVVAGSGFGDLFTWTADGHVRPGWPISLPPAPPPLAPVVAAVLAPPALGDLDGDGSLEIVTATNNNFLYAFREDGTMMPGFPVALGSENAGFSAPALADVDGDGRLEIFLGIRLFPGEPGPRLFAVRWNGTPLPGFPLTVVDDIFDSVVLADLDGDGRLWIVSGVNGITQSLMVWNALTGEPRPGFPRSFGAKGVHSTPTVGDITGDGYPDIVLPVNFELGGGLIRLFAWDRAGNPITPFPLMSFGVEVAGLLAAPITDLNRDDFVDVMFTDNQRVGTIRARLHAFTLNQPFDARTLEWPTKGRDSQHTGVYRVPLDELVVSGGTSPDFLFLSQPPGSVTTHLRRADARHDLASALAREGWGVVEINDRPIPAVPARLLSAPGIDAGPVALGRPDYLVQMDGTALAHAVLARLRAAGVGGGEERTVRLKVASGMVERRRLAGEIRLRVRMPVGG